MSFNTYEINQVGPIGGKIKEIIFRDNNCIVYMDISDTIQWSSSESLNENFGEIQNKVSDWESKANNIFTKKEAYQIKCLLAEAYARILYDKNISLSRDIIDRAIQKIQVQGREVLKLTYALASFLATALLLFIVFISRSNKDYLISDFDRDAYDIWMTMLFGGIGAYIFTTLRLRDYKPNILISKTIHIWDGILRIFYGTIAGLIISIAIKSNLVLGFLKEVNKGIYITVFMGLVAGASEMLIPSIIKQIEDKTKQSPATCSTDIDEH